MFKWLQGLSGKARSIDSYAQATSIRSERHRQSGQLDVEAYQLVQHDSAFVAMITSRLAEDSAAVRLRLYRPQDGQGPRKGERRVPKRHTKWLREGVVPFTSKAADIADTAGDMIEVVSHPILDLLANPNPYQTGQAFRQMRHKLEGVAGDSAVIAGDSAHNVIEWAGSGQRLAYMHALLSHYVTPYAGEFELIEGFWYGRDRSSVQHFTEDQVAYSKWADDIHRPLRGRPPHADFLPEQQLYLAVIQQALATMDNQIHPNVVVNVEGPLSEPAQQALEQHLQSTYSGVQNTGKPIILSNGKATVDVLNHPPKDLSGEEVIEARVSALAAAYKIPESEIKNNSANLTNSIVGSRSYALKAIGPRVGAEAEFWTQYLCEQAFGLDGWCLVPDPSFVPEDEAAKATTTTSLVSSGIMTQNEARQEFGLGDIEGGDVLRVNGVSVAALDEQATQPVGGGFGFPMFGPEPVATIPGAEKSHAEPERDESKPPVSFNSDDPVKADSENEPVTWETIGYYDAETLEEIPAPEKVSVGNGHSGAKVPTGDSEEYKSCACCSHDSPPAAVIKMTDLWNDMGEYKAKSVDDAQDRSPYREDLPETATLYRNLRTAQSAYWKALDARMEAKPFGLKSHGVALRLKDRDMVDTLVRAWLGVAEDQTLSQLVLQAGSAEQFRKMVEFGVLTGAEELVRDYGQPTDEGRIPLIERPEITQSVTEHEERFRQRMRSYGDTTAERIRGHIVEALDNNEGLGAMKKRLREVVNSPKRAAMIARTETAHAQVEGRKSAFRSNPNVKGKRFRVAAGACPFCEAMNRQFGNKVIPLDTPFIDVGAKVTGTDGREMTNNLGMPIDVPVHPHCRCDLDLVIAGAE